MILPTQCQIIILTLGDLILFSSIYLCVELKIVEIVFRLKSLTGNNCLKLQKDL